MRFALALTVAIANAVHLKQEHYIFGLDADDVKAVHEFDNTEVILDVKTVAGVT